MKGDKRTSPNKIYDVAGAAGVSLATVSRVLNHPEKVKPATREKIERIIKEKGIKQYAVANKAGYTKQQFNDMLNGRKIIKAIDILAIAKALEVSPNDLYGIKENAV